MPLTWLQKLTHSFKSVVPFPGFLLLPFFVVACEGFQDARLTTTPPPRAFIKVFISQDLELDKSPPPAADAVDEAAETVSPNPDPDADSSHLPLLTAARTQANALQLFFSQLNDPSLIKGLSIQAEVRNPLGEEQARSKRATRKKAPEIKSGPPNKPKPPVKPSVATLYFASAEARDREALLKALGPNEIGALTCGPPAGERRILSLFGFLSAAAKRTARFLKERGDEQVVLLVDPTPYGERGRIVFGQAARESGLQILSEGVLEEDALKIPLPDRRDVPLVIWTEDIRAISILQSLRQMGYEDFVFGPAVPHPDLTFDTTHPWTPNLFLKEAEGVLAVAHKLLVADTLPKTDPHGPRLRKFREEYEIAFESPPSLLGACTYDALVFAAENLRALAHPLDLATLPPRTLQRLLSAPSWSGVSGIYVFQTAASGDRVGLLDLDAFVMVKAEGGRWQLVQ